MATNFMGMDGFYWFQGVIEDRNDPLKLGRYRVRLLGLHSKELEPNEETGEGIPVDALSWALPMMPVTGAAMNGIGETPNLVEGTWVFGFARDGRTFQNLVIIGALPGAPELPPINEGFNDTGDTTNRPKRPDDVAEHYPKTAYLKEPDINRLARNEKINETIVQKKKDNLDSGAGWTEPVTPYAAVYPYNKVQESESGHIIERDDTPGAERTHDYHRSGSFVEVHPDGKKVVKVVNDSYEIVSGDNFIHIKTKPDGVTGGNLNITTDGTISILGEKGISIGAGIGYDISLQTSGGGKIRLN